MTMNERMSKVISLLLDLKANGQFNIDTYDKARKENGIAYSLSSLDRAIYGEYMVKAVQDLESAFREGKINEKTLQEEIENRTNALILWKPSHSTSTTANLADEMKHGVDQAFLTQLKRIFGYMYGV